MSYIVEIKKLKNKYNHSINGYIGIDIKSGKLHYYSMYDKNGFFLNNGLTEFDESKTLDERNRLCSNIDENTNIIENEPNEIDILIKEVIKKHLIRNMNMSFETHALNKNTKNLSIEYTTKNSIIGNIHYTGIYTPVENSIKLPQNLDNDKSEIIDTLLHETGHMKTSKVFYKNKQINIKTGFYNKAIKTTRIKLYNGDIFLKLDKVYDNKQNIKDRIIEEIMNEYDIKQIKSDYKNRYPNIGHILNYLCDYRLEYERYKENGIDMIYDSLLKIIDDEKLIDELFENILELEEYYRWNLTPKNNDTVKILKKYAINKKIAKQ